MDCPTEIWTQIFWLACTDTGTTGRSLSQTSRYFRSISRRVRLRSIAIRGIVQMVSFVHMIEALPQDERFVENLYISMCNTSELSGDRRSELLVDLERTGIDLIDTTIHQQYYTCFKGMFEDISSEVDMHAVFRILLAVSPSVEFLSITCGESCRPSVFFPIDFPRLSELVLHGPYDAYDCPSQLDMLNNLRRLRLTYVYTDSNDQTLAAIARKAPNLTHLRFDHRNLYSDTVCCELTKAVQTPYETHDPRNALPESRKLPASLQRFLIHPGDLPPRGMCGTSMLLRFSSVRALQRFASNEPRVFLFKEYPREKTFSPFYHEESLQEWCERINGGLAYWSEVNGEDPA